jgi:hypothetical protein
MFNIGKIVARLHATCPKMANMEQMSRVVPHGLAALAKRAQPVAKAIWLRVPWF